MSFGIGIGDILKVSELAYQLWKACTESATEFSELSGQLNTLHRLLKALVQEVETALSLLNRRGGDRVDEFEQIFGKLKSTAVGSGGGCQEISLDRDWKRQAEDAETYWVCDRRLESTEREAGTASHCYCTFYDTLQSGSLAGIEDHVELIKQAMSSTNTRDKPSVEQQLRAANIIPETRRCR